MAPPADGKPQHPRTDPSGEDAEIKEISWNNIMINNPLPLTEGDWRVTLSPNGAFKKNHCGHEVQSIEPSERGQRDSFIHKSTKWKALEKAVSPILSPFLAQAREHCPSEDVKFSKAAFQKLTSSSQHEVGDSSEVDQKSFPHSNEKNTRRKNKILSEEEKKALKAAIEDSHQKSKGTCHVCGMEYADGSRTICRCCMNLQKKGNSKLTYNDQDSQKSIEDSKDNPPETDKSVKGSYTGEFFSQNRSLSLDFKPNSEIVSASGLRFKRTNTESNLQSPLLPKKEKLMITKKDMQYNEKDLPKIVSTVEKSRDGADSGINKLAIVGKDNVVRQRSNIPDSSSPGKQDPERKHFGVLKRSMKRSTTEGSFTSNRTLENKKDEVNGEGKENTATNAIATREQVLDNIKRRGLIKPVSKKETSDPIISTRGGKDIEENLSGGFRRNVTFKLGRSKTTFGKMGSDRIRKMASEARAKEGRKPTSESQTKNDNVAAASDPKNRKLSNYQRTHTVVGKVNTKNQKATEESTKSASSSEASDGSVAAGNAEEAIATAVGSVLMAEKEVETQARNVVKQVVPNSIYKLFTGGDDGGFPCESEDDSTDTSRNDIGANSMQPVHSTISTGDNTLAKADNLHLVGSDINIIKSSGNAMANKDTAFSDNTIVSDKIQGHETTEEECQYVETMKDSDSYHSNPADSKLEDTESEDGDSTCPSSEGYFSSGGSNNGVLQDRTRVKREGTMDYFQPNLPYRNNTGSDNGPSFGHTDSERDCEQFGDHLSKIDRQDVVFAEAEYTEALPLGTIEDSIWNQFLADDEEGGLGHDEVESTQLYEDRQIQNSEYDHESHTEEGQLANVGTSMEMYSTRTYFGAYETDVDTGYTVSRTNPQEKNNRALVKSSWGFPCQSGSDTSTSSSDDSSEGQNSDAWYTGGFVSDGGNDGDKRDDRVYFDDKEGGNLSDSDLYTGELFSKVEFKSNDTGNTSENNSTQFQENEFERSNIWNISSRCQMHDWCPQSRSRRKRYDRVVCLNRISGQCGRRRELAENPISSACNVSNNHLAENPISSACNLSNNHNGPNHKEKTSENGKAERGTYTEYDPLYLSSIIKEERRERRPNNFGFLEFKNFAKYDKPENEEDDTAEGSSIRDVKYKRDILFFDEAPPSCRQPKSIYYNMQFIDTYRRSEREADQKSAPLKMDEDYQNYKSESINYSNNCSTDDCENYTGCFRNEEALKPTHDGLFNDKPSSFVFQKRQQDISPAYFNLGTTKSYYDPEPDTDYAFEKKMKESQKRMEKPKVLKVGGIVVRNNVECEVDYAQNINMDMQATPTTWVRYDTGPNMQEEDTSEYARNVDYDDFTGQKPWVSAGSRTPWREPQIQPLDSDKSKDKSWTGAPKKVVKNLGGYVRKWF